jgi:hypothetical protein
MCVESTAARGNAETVEGIVLLYVCRLPLLHPTNRSSGFWMSDKPLVQQRLASDLSSIVLQIDPKSEEEDTLARDMAALDFIQGFWEAIIREWVGSVRFRCVTPSFPLEISLTS